MADQTDDLAATRTEGFKVGEKKTLEEYNKLGKPCDAQVV
jgi:Rho GDP-dissociation inhibitor